MEENYCIKIENISKSYKKQKVLKDISFNIKKGEIFMPIKSRKFTDRKSAKEFADANNSKVERFNDPSGYFKYIVRLTESENKKS